VENLTCTKHDHRSYLSARFTAGDVVEDAIKAAIGAYLGRMLVRGALEREGLNRPGEHS
jgi:hypothetical protein